MNEVYYSIAYDEKLEVTANKCWYHYTVERYVTFKKRGRFVCIDIAWIDV